jgi:hypothetical protein
MAPNLTANHVATRLKALGKYRVMTAQAVASEGPPDGIDGAHMLALGLRESDLNNINNREQTDKGCFQITELYHAAFLKSEPGCPEKTWVAAPGHTAFEDGYCPRYTPAVVYALGMLKNARKWGMARGVKTNDSVGFAIAAYNAGAGGAIRGYNEGDVDKYTTGGDYSAWVLYHRDVVNKWLNAHPSWKPS